MSSLETRGHLHQPEEGPVISLPQERGEQLRLKLEEYKGRIDPTTHPDLALLMGDPNAYRVKILGTLLDAGSLKTHDLSLLMSSELGDKFRPELFDISCCIIKDYCETGGANTVGGTGLPIADNLNKE